jgi:hypothetical protein
MLEKKANQTLDAVQENQCATSTHSDPTCKGVKKGKNPPLNIGCNTTTKIELFQSLSHFALNGYHIVVGLSTMVPPGV